MDPTSAQPNWPCCPTIPTPAPLPCAMLCGTVREWTSGGHHRHDGACVASRTDRCSHRIGRCAGAAQPCRIARQSRQRTGGDRGSRWPTRWRRRRPGQGKLTAVPIAVVRGLSVRDDDSTAAQLVRGGVDDLFWLGTPESIELGRRQALLLRRSVRRFTDRPVRSGSSGGRGGGSHRTGAAPHPPARFVWLADPDRRATLLDAMTEAWRADRFSATVWRRTPWNDGQQGPDPV